MLVPLQELLMAEAPSLYVVTVFDLFAIVSVLFVTSINIII